MCLHARPPGGSIIATDAEARNSLLASMRAALSALSSVHTVANAAKSANTKTSLLGKGTKTRGSHRANLRASRACKETARRLHLVHEQSESTVNQCSCSR